MGHEIVCLKYLHFWKTYAIFYQNGYRNRDFNRHDKNTICAQYQPIRTFSYLTAPKEDVLPFATIALFFFINNSTVSHQPSNIRRRSSFAFNRLSTRALNSAATRTYRLRIPGSSDRYFSASRRTCPAHPILGCVSFTNFRSRFINSKKGVVRCFRSCLPV